MSLSKHGSKYGSYHILSFGEILWDILPSGKKLGGAPANFAYHCSQLGADVRLLSRVGKDKLGDEILDYCGKIILSTELIGRDDTAPTGTVDIKLGPDGQAKYRINEPVAWDRLEFNEAAFRRASEADAIAFGSLAARSPQNRQTLQSLFHAAPPNVLRVLDLNLRDPFCERNIIEFVLGLANVLKLNDEELDRVAAMLEIAAKTTEDRLSCLLEQFGFRLIILTCGAHGSWLADKSQQVFEPGIAVEVVDTVGAGDAFTAATVVGYLNGDPLPEIARQATRLAAYVCTQNGGMPPIPTSFGQNHVMRNDS